MARSVEEGPALLDEIEKREELKEFHLLPAAQADLLRRLAGCQEAAEAYRRSLRLATNDIERRFFAAKGGGGRIGQRSGNLSRGRTGKPGHPLGKSKKLVCGVAAEEGVGLPARRAAVFGAVEEQAAGKFLVGRRGLQIDRLVHVIARSVIAVG